MSRLTRQGHGYILLIYLNFKIHPFRTNSSCCFFFYFEIRYDDEVRFNKHAKDVFDKGCCRCLFKKGLQRGGGGEGLRVEERAKHFTIQACGLIEYDYCNRSIMRPSCKAEPFIP